jgi:TonB family protein
MEMNVRFRLVSALALPVLLVVLSGAARADSTDDVANELERARQLVSRQDFLNACKAYTKADELAQGKSAPSLIGLSDCYTRVRDRDKAVEAARQALAVAASPDERAQAIEALRKALLHQPDEKSWAEAAALLKEEMASWRNGGRSEDDIQHLFCSLLGDLSGKDPNYDRQVSARNDFVRKLDPDAPLQLGGKVKRPEIRHQTKPEVPPGTILSPGVRNTVIVETIIDAQGRVRSTRVLKGQPQKLAESAEQAVREWTFSPATLDGTPVPVCYILTVTYQVR